MDKADILKKIIEEKGSCDWVQSSDICTTCPLGNLAHKQDGNLYSCVEAVLGRMVDASKEQSDVMYLEAAERALLELDIETALEK